MFENVDGRTDGRRTTDAGVTGILIAHLRAFGSGELKTSQQQQNHRLRTDSSLSHWGGGGGLNAFYWYQIFALDSAVVKVHKLFSSHGSLLTIAIYHHGETL